MTELANIVVWNMGRRDDRRTWNYLLNPVAPDLALLQETTPPSSQTTEGDHLVHAEAYPGEHSWGSAIFAPRGTVKELPLPPEHRGFLVAAEVELPRCPPLVAVSVHAKLVEGYVRSNLDDAFESVYPLIDGRRCIVGGDFNLSRNYDKAYKTTHHTEFLDKVLPEKGLVSAHPVFHPQEEQTFWGPQAKIAYQDDHVYVSADLKDRLSACDVVPRDGVEDLSDHSPLRLSLELT